MMADLRPIHGAPVRVLAAAVSSVAAGLVGTTGALALQVVPGSEAEVTILGPPPARGTGRHDEG